MGAGAGLEGQKDGGAPPVTASEGDAAPGVAAERRGRGQGRGGGSVPQKCPSQRQPVSWGQHFPPPHSRTSCFTRRGPQSAAGAHPSASPSPRGWLAPPGLSRCHPPEGNRRDGTGRDGALPALRALRAQGGPGAGFGTSSPAAPPLPAPGRTPAPAPGEQHSESSTQGLSRAEGFAPLPITAAALSDGAPQPSGCALLSARLPRLPEDSCCFARPRSWHGTEQEAGPHRCCTRLGRDAGLSSVGQAWSQPRFPAPLLSAFRPSSPSPAPAGVQLRAGAQPRAAPGAAEFSTTDARTSPSRPSTPARQSCHEAEGRSGASISYLPAPRQQSPPPPGSAIPVTAPG